MFQFGVGCNYTLIIVYLYNILFILLNNPTKMTDCTFNMQHFCGLPFATLEMLITELVAKTVYFEDGMCVVCVLADKASISHTPLNQLSPLPKN